MSGSSFTKNCLSSSKRTSRNTFFKSSFSLASMSLIIHCFLIVFVVLTLQRREELEAFVQYAYPPRYEKKHCIFSRTLGYFEDKNDGIEKPVVGQTTGFNKNEILP